MPADDAAVEDVVLFAAAATRAQVAADSGAGLSTMRPIHLPQPTHVLLEPEAEVTALAVPSTSSAAASSAVASESAVDPGSTPFSRLLARMLPAPADQSTAPQRNNPFEMSRLLGEMGAPEPFMLRCCPALSWEDRVMGFVGCYAIGAALTLSSLFAFAELAAGRPEQFAYRYSFGNVLAICSSFFLAGPRAQCKRMMAPARIWASSLYLGSIVLCLISALVFSEPSLTVGAGHPCCMVGPILTGPRHPPATSMRRERGGRALSRSAFSMRAQSQASRLPPRLDLRAILRIGLVLPHIHTAWTQHHPASHPLLLPLLKAAQTAGSFVGPRVYDWQASGACEH